METEDRELDHEPVEALGVEPLVSALIAHKMASITQLDEKISLDQAVDLTNILLARLENERRAAEKARESGGGQ